MWRSQTADRGFATIPGVVSVTEVERLLECFALGRHARSRAGIRHALALEPVRELANEECLLALAREILGASAQPFKATLFDKSQDANWLVAWHQDTALPLRERRETPGWGPWSQKEGVIYAHAPACVLEQVVALRVHLDDSTSNNGPLRVLPGTHTSGVLNDEEVHSWSERISPVECVVGCGGVVAMRPLLIHASSKSQAPAARRVLHIEYASAHAFPEGIELAAS